MPPSRPWICLRTPLQYQTETSIEQDQRLSCLRRLRCAFVNTEALKFFRGAIARKGGNNTINRQAEDRIRDLKDIILVQEKKEKEEEKV